MTTAGTKRGELAPDTVATYHAVTELMRSGVPNAKQAIQAHADAIGLGFDAVNARYYAARKRLDPDAPRGPGAKPARPGRAPATAAAAANGAASSVPELLEQAAALLERAAAHARRDARDAEQWRAVAAMLQQSDADRVIVAGMIDVNTGQEGFLVAITDPECRALMDDRRSLVFHGNGHPAVHVIAAATHADLLALMQEYAVSVDADALEDPEDDGAAV